MSKFEIVVRSIAAFVMLVFANVWSKIIDSYISVQSAPALMFSEGPEQRFGQDLLNTASTAGVVVFVGLAILFLYPVGKHVYTKLTSKESADEAA